MYKEQITDKEGICLLSIFIMGSTLILGTGGDAKNDAWISGIVGMIMVIPMIIVYGRILILFPGKDIYEILIIVFGKYVGSFIAMLYVWYSFHLGALVMRNFGEFINTVTMPETPILFPILCLSLVSIMAARYGIEVMGRISASILPVLLIIILIVAFLVIPQLQLSNVKPILGGGFYPVLIGGFSAFSFPYAESVIFTSAAFALKTKRSIYRVYFYALIISGSIIVFLTLRNIMVLGIIIGQLYFPSHVAVSKISIGSFLERIEVTVAIVFVFGAFIKCAVCLFSASKGVARIFNLKDYRSVVIQLGILMAYLAYIVYDNIMMMEFWAFKIYPYYAFPFQVILPILIFIAALVKTKKHEK